MNKLLSGTLSCLSLRRLQAAAFGLAGVLYLGAVPAAMAQDDGAYYGETYYSYDQLVAMAESSSLQSGAAQPMSSFENPVIIWEPASPLDYEMPLDGSHLNAEAYDPADVVGGEPVAGATELPGTFVYSPSAGTVLDVGEQSLSLVFSPEDYGAYNVVTASRTVVVDKMNPEITWADPAAIDYGVPLHNGILNAEVFRPTNVGGAQFSIPAEGTLTYDPALGTYLDAGTHTLTVTFTPVDSDNINPVTAEVEITVNQVTPDVSWASPADEVYEFELTVGSSPLNASASYDRYEVDATGELVTTPIAEPVAGVYLYFNGSKTPGNSLGDGDRLDAGTYTLATIFAPSDSANLLQVNSAPTVSFTIDPKPVVLDLVLPAGYVTTDDPVDLSALPTSDANPTTENDGFTSLPVTFSLSPDEAWADITAGGELTFPGWTPDGDTSKSVTVQVDFAGTGNYVAASTTATTSLEKAPLDAAFGAVPTDLAWQCDPLTYDLAQLDTESLSPTWSLVSGAASLSGSVLTVEGAGSIVVEAEIAETDRFQGATVELDPIVVGKGAPAIDWSVASTTLTYGDDLSSILVASVSCPDTADALAGTLAYSESGNVLAAGDILDAGEYTIDLEFTPDNTDDWMVVGDSVTITVDPFPLELTVDTTPDSLTWYRQEGKTIEESYPGPVDFAVSSNDPTGNAPLQYTVTPATGVMVDETNQQLVFGEGSVPDTYTITISQPGNANYASADPVTVDVEVRKSAPLLEKVTASAQLTYGEPVEKWFEEAFQAREAIIEADSGDLHARLGAHPGEADYTTLVPIANLAEWTDGGEDGDNGINTGFPLSTTDLQPFYVEYANFPLSDQYLAAGDTRSFTVILYPEQFNYTLSRSITGSVVVDPADTTLSWEGSAATLTYEDTLADWVSGSAAPVVAFDWTNYSVATDSTETVTYSFSAANGGTDLFGDRGDLTVTVWDNSDPANPVEITELADLNEAQLADVVLDAGDYLLEVEFAPGDTVIPESEFGTSEAIVFNGQNFNGSSVILELTVEKKQLEISFDPIADKWTTSAPFSPSTSLNVADPATAGVSVDLAISEGADFVDLAAGEITPVGWDPADTTPSQSVTVTASAMGNDNYLAAADVTQSFTLSKVAQAISLDPAGPVSVDYLDPTFDVTATVVQDNGPAAGAAPTGTTVSFALGGGTPDDNVVSLSASGMVATLTVGEAGTDSLLADVTGSLLFLPAEATPVDITVNPIDVPADTLTWDPAELAYPCPLDTTHLNATSSDVPGVWEYDADSVAGTVLEAGLRTLSATFTPDDTRNYNEVTLEREITVAKGTPVITWTPVTTHSYPEAFDFTGDNAASASVPCAADAPAGSFAYAFSDTGDSAGGVVSEPGDYAITATFTPTDSANYESASMEITFTVEKGQVYVDFQQAVEDAIFDPTLDQSVELIATAFYVDAAGNRVDLPDLPVTFSVTYGTALIGTPGDETFNEDPAGSHALFVQRGLVDILAATAETDLWLAAVDGNLDGTAYPLTWETEANKIPVTIEWPWKGEGTADDTIIVGKELTSNELNAVAKAFDETGTLVEVAGTYVYLPDVGAFFSQTGPATVELNFLPTNISRYFAPDAQKTVTVLEDNFQNNFDQWAADNGLTGTDGTFDPMADSSGNGSPDLFAFAFGTDPLDPAALPPVRIQMVDGSFFVTYPEAAQAKDYVSYVIEGSADLSAFGAVGEADLTEISRNPDGDTEVVTVRIDDETVSFVRVGVVY